MTDAVLTLQEAADELGVHYMTAYRYVRLGVLDATKSGGVWQVRRSALDHFREQAAEASAATGPSGKGGARNRKAPWSTRLESRLVAGDAPGSAFQRRGQVLRQRFFIAELCGGQYGRLGLLDFARQQRLPLHQIV